MSTGKKGYCVCPVENRGALLFELVSRYFNRREQMWNKKIAIIFSHDNSVKYFQELFMLLGELPIMPMLKTDLKSATAMKDLKMFSEAGTGALAISTEAALKTLSYLEVDTVIQFAPPKNIEFINQISALSGLYLLFVRPEEEEFVTCLQDEHSMTINEMYVPWKNVKKLPAEKLEKYYQELHSMNIHSKCSYKAYMDSLRDHELSDYFNLNGIDIKEVAAGYCLSIPPYYKMVKETPRYETEMKEKELKMSEKPPTTAKKVVKTFIKVKETTEEDKIKKILKKKGIKIVDGNVDLKYVKPTSKDQRVKAAKHRQLAKRTSDCKALRKQLWKIDGGRRVKLPVPVRRR